jgi:hypothetical protein
MLALVALLLAGPFDTPPKADPGIKCSDYIKQPDGGWLPNTGLGHTLPALRNPSPLTAMLLSREIMPGSVSIDGTDVYQYLEAHCDKKG